MTYRQGVFRWADGDRDEGSKKEYGKSVVTGFAKIHGYPVGIVSEHV
jgi:3-methylcrotonyl-CoA carboxylase beta subunit